MRIGFRAFWLQKAGNSGDEYEDAFAPADLPGGDCDEFRCAVADGATETSFSGLWAQILVDAFAHEGLAHVKPQTTKPLAARWRQAIDARAVPLPWYAQEKLERGAFSSLMGLTLYADGRWRALCVGDSCLFHLRPRQTMRAFPYHLPDQFNNHPALISTLGDSTTAQTARGTWHPGDYFLLMTDALAHFFLSQRKLRVQLAADSLDQAGFEQLVAYARASKICRNDDVTLLKIVPMAGEGQDGGVAQPE
jgi:hypothetical protein